MTNAKNITSKPDKARCEVQREVNEELWPLVARYSTLRETKTTSAIKETHQKKLKKLAERQDCPLGRRSERSVLTIDDIELPHWIQHLLSLGTKHPVSYKIKETYFLADIDSFLSDIKHRKVPGEALCEIEATKDYSRLVKQTPPDRVVEKARKFLKGNGIVAVLFNKGIGFCVMRKTTYISKPVGLLDPKQSNEKRAVTDPIVVKIGKKIN